MPQNVPLLPPSVGFMLGGMIARVAGPIAQDWFECKTNLGREIAKRKLDAQLEKQRQINEIDFENKLAFSELEHKKRLQELHESSELARQRAEEQMLLSYSDWQQKVFWDKCFPLRNPYEMPMGFEPVFDENSKRLKGCKLTTIQLPNKRQLVPLRVITAIKDTTHPHAATVNGDLSSFLVHYYAANGEHAVISDIGAWKDEAPINDASINYLFKGLRGQPVVVLAPSYTNGGSIVRMKFWSWGLGEQLAYPIGFDFGWFDLSSSYRYMLAKEVIEYQGAISKINSIKASKELEFDYLLLSEIKDKKNELHKEEIKRLCSLLKIPNEIKESLQRRINDYASMIFSCAIGMYADGFHLFEYGTMPILPDIMPTMQDAIIVFPYVRDFYITLINVALSKNIISPQQAIEFDFKLGELGKLLGIKNEEIIPICDNLHFLLKKAEHVKGIEENYRVLTQRITKLEL